MSIPGDPLPVTPPSPTVPALARGARVDVGMWLARVAALVALGISVYLAYVSIAAEGHVVGCDDTSQVGCDDVLTSRWATWLGISVGLPSVVVFLTAFAATWLAGTTPLSNARRVGWVLLATTSSLAAGAAIWFVGLQLFALRSHCWYCLTLHACAIFLACFTAWRLPQEMIAGRRLAGAAILGAGMGAVGVATLIGGQLLVAPMASEMKVVVVTGRNPQANARSDAENLNDAESSAAMHPASKPVLSSSDENQDAAGRLPGESKKSSSLPTHPQSSRRVSLLGGMASIDLYDYPVLGNREAERPLLELFDYTCTHCRELHAMVRNVHPEYGDKLTLVCLPLAMNSKCNDYVHVDHPEHAAACEFARLAIAVWRARPEQFEEFHNWMMKGARAPTPEAAGAEATRLIGATELQQALADPAVNERLRDNCRIYALASDSTLNRVIPKLIFESAVSSGMPSSEQQFRQFLESQVKLTRIKQ